MVNLSKLTVLFAYNLKPLAYKPRSVTETNTTSHSLFVVPDGEVAQFLSPASPNPAVPSSTNSMHFVRGQLEERSVEISQDSQVPVVVIDQNPTDTHVTVVSDVSQDADCTVQPYDAPPVLNQAFPPYDQTTANVYRYRQQQSVNLGSWFVHEDWMTQSLFVCAAEPKTAEIDIATGWGSTNNAKAILEKHWDTFITQPDFDYLASIGINTVRLPIGYWSLGPEFVQGTPFQAVSEVYANSWPRVVRAVNQAGNSGLGVLLDLHGAPGSQNGQSHSGISDGKVNLFSVEENKDKTIDILTFLADKFALVNNVVGIQLLNEPVYDDGLEAFYIRAISAMRNVSEGAAKLPLYLHDGFDLNRFSNFLSSRTDFVVLDHHSYFVFTPSDEQESGMDHTADVEGTIAKSFVQASTRVRRNMVIDEYSCALSPDSLKSEKDADQVRKTFCTEQAKVYTNDTAGWGFWSYNKEDCDSDPGWCFKASVGTSLPNTFFSYGKPTTKQEANNLAEGARNLMIPHSADVLNLVKTLTDSIFGRRAFVSHHRGRRSRLSRRFEIIHQRDKYPLDADALKNSTSKGYTDGFTTAKVFASYNTSRLGFTGQFMDDAIRVAGPTVIAPGTEEGYKAGFMKGLQHGEDAVMGK